MRVQGCLSIATHRGRRQQCSGPGSHSLLLPQGDSCGPLSGFRSPPRDLAQAQRGRCWCSSARSGVSWQPGTVGRSDLCNSICGYCLGPGLVAKGAGALDAVCSQSHSLVSWFPGEHGAQGGCVTSALGTTLLPWGKQGHGSFRCALTLTPV
jgi:hypothetical protein